MKNISFKNTLPFIALVVLFVTSCKKSNDLQVAGEASGAVTGLTTTQIVGRWGSSFNPSTYDTVYVNLANGTQADTVGVITSHIFMRSSNNSRILPVTGYTMKYLYAPTADYEDLSITDFETTAPAAGLGVNTSQDEDAPNGYFKYDEESQPEVITGFYVLITPTSGVGTSYVFTITDIIPEGTLPTYNRGKYDFYRGTIN